MSEPVTAASSAPAKIAAHVVHAMPGRVRLRLPSARGRPERLEHVRSRLAAQRGVTAVNVDHRTGSVVVEGEVALQALGALGEAEGLFSLVPPQMLKPLAEDMMRGVETVDSRIRFITHGRVGLLSALATVLVAVAAVQLLRGRVGAPAVTLLWYAFATVMMAQAGRRPALS